MWVNGTQHAFGLFYFCGGLLGTQAVTQHGLGLYYFCRGLLGNA